MIFAEMVYEQDYSEFHSALVGYIKTEFSDIEHGLQGDSWIWIFENEQKVEIDTFSSMKHQIKSPANSTVLATKVIEHIAAKYTLVVYPAPELEGHE